MGLDFQMPDWLAQAIAGVEQSTKPFAEYQVCDSIYAAQRARGLADDQVGEAALAELAGFIVRPVQNKDEAVWPTYFQPSMVIPTDTPGQVRTSPDLQRGGADRWGYWKDRARASAHPVMRARYADLCWDCATFVGEKQRDPEDARIAIKAYLAAVQTGQPGLRIHACERLGRALELALLINDTGQQAAVIQEYFDYVGKIRERGRVGTWCFIFDDLLPARGGPSLVPAQENTIVKLLEDELGSAGKADPISAHAAKGAADRLAVYYGRNARTEDQKRVLRRAAEVYEEVAASDGTDMQALFWLEAAHEYYLRAGERTSADRTLVEMRAAGLKVQGQMRPITVQTKADPKKIKAYVDAMTADTLDQALENFALRFVPNRDNLITEIKDSQSKFISESLFGHRAILEDGHVIARVGPYDADPEGKLAHSVAQHVGFGAPFREMVLQSIVTKYGPTADAMVSFLRVSPLYAADRESILKAGVEAHLKGDYLKAIHVLIPQMERALLQLAELLGRPTRKPATRGGGGVFHVRNLNDFLGDEAVRASLGPSLHVYLDSILANPKGMNLRNRVCHGLCPPEAFTRPWGDLVLQCAFALSMVRKSERPEPESGDSTASTT